jgi:hypothetical protein
MLLQDRKQDGMGHDEAKMIFTPRKTLNEKLI